MSKVLKRSLRIAGHPTSVSLEHEFWDALKSIAQAQKRSVADLVTEVDETRTGGLSSALRVYVLKTLQEKTKQDSTEV